MWRSLTRAEDLQRLIEHVMTAALVPRGLASSRRAEVNIVIVNPETRKTKFSSIASRPGERETSRSVFKDLREAWKRVEQGLETLTGLVLKASLESPGACWSKSALCRLANLLENNLPDDLPDDEKAKCRAQHGRLKHLVGVPKGFLVLSNGARLHMVGVIPA
eukprot:6017298-Amphidinium_carterae.1